MCVCVSIGYSVCLCEHVYLNILLVYECSEVICLSCVCVFILLLSVPLCLWACVFCTAACVCSPALAINEIIKCLWCVKWQLAAVVTLRVCERDACVCVFVCVCVCARSHTVRCKVVINNAEKWSRGSKRVWEKAVKVRNMHMFYF